MRRRGLSGISVYDAWPHFAVDKRTLWLLAAFLPSILMRQIEKRYYLLKTSGNFYLAQGK
jgi:hypothetical protein